MGDEGPGRTGNRVHSFMLNTEHERTTRISAPLSSPNASYPPVVVSRPHDPISTAKQAFTRAFAAAPAALAISPARINLIGEHTDYNDGLVMPIAIDAWCACAAGVRTGSERPGSRAFAADIGESATFDTAVPSPPNANDPTQSAIRRGHWSSYVAGVLHETAATHTGRASPALPPIDLAITSTIPIGAGLSSSAALEAVVALAAAEAWGLPEPDRLDLARRCQRAEHTFAGVPCGLMDQFAVLHARPGHAMLLDCRSMAARHVPLSDQVAIVVVDTGVRHALASSEYARRRAECAEACTRLGIASLRDAAPESLVASSESWTRRARHVVSENQRVRAFGAALTAADWPEAGRLMLKSHASLRDDYEVSCPELDHAVEGLASLPGVYGARMTGAGFGGCAIAMVEATAAKGACDTARQHAWGVSARVVTPVGAASSWAAGD